MQKEEIYDDNDNIEEEIPQNNGGPVFKRDNPVPDYDRSEYTNPKSAKEAFQSNKKMIIAMIAATVWCLVWFFLMVFDKVPRLVMNLMIMPLLIGALIAYYKYKKDHDV